MIDNAGKPGFRVTASDDTEKHFVGDTPSNCWMSILKIIVGKTKHRKSTTISGVAQFGLREPKIQTLINKLPIDQPTSKKRKEPTQESDQPRKKARTQTPKEKKIRVYNRRKSAPATLQTTSLDVFDNLTPLEECEHYDEMTPQNYDLFNFDSVPLPSLMSPLPQSVELYVDNNLPLNSSLEDELDVSTHIDEDSLVSKLRFQREHVKQMLQTESFVMSTLEREVDLDGIDIAAYSRIRAELPHLTVDEIREGLEECPDVENLLELLETRDFMRQVRRKVALRVGGQVVSNEQDTVNEADCEQEVIDRSSRTKKMTKRKATKEPTKQEPIDESIEDQNNHYYRNLAKGEAKKIGVWSPQERKLFEARLIETNIINDKRKQWGIFSKGIPGRTGHQCYGYYGMYYSSNPQSKNPRRVPTIENKEDDLIEEEEIVQVKVETPKKQAKKRGRPRKNSSPEVVKSNKFEDKVQAALSKKDSDPNLYYYYFLADGEEKKSGTWSQYEKGLFEARLKEIDVTATPKQWGIFSQTIPGRTGYQCSSYYNAHYRYYEDQVTKVAEPVNVELKSKKIIFEDSDDLEDTVIISE